MCAVDWNDRCTSYCGMQCKFERCLIFKWLIFFLLQARLYWGSCYSRGENSDHWPFFILHRRQTCHKPEPGLELSLALSFPLIQISSRNSFLSDGASPVIRLFLLVEFQGGEGEQHTDKRFPSEAGRPKHLSLSLGNHMTPQKHWTPGSFCIAKPQFLTCNMKDRSSAHFTGMLC